MMHDFFHELSQNVSACYRNGRNGTIQPTVHNDFYDCSFVIDLRKGQMTDRKGFKILLGYEDGNMDLSGFYNKIHPEDSTLVQRITELSISHCLYNPNPEGTYRLMMIYRQRTRQGNYIRVLKKLDVAEMDVDGSILKLIMRLKNITFLDTSVQVHWVFDAPNLNKEEFFNEVYAPYREFFTDRELDVIRQMALGITNHEIGDHLCISSHTVATHRKNILKKAQCKTAKQLIQLCRSMGILSPNTPNPKILS